MSEADPAQTTVFLIPRSQETSLTTGAQKGSLGPKESMSRMLYP